MSIGYLDEEDPTLRPEGPAEPGSADAFIDQTNAQPLAASVSGVLPDDNAFPPPVPPEAPGMVPIPPALPGAGPAPIPLAGATPPPIPAAAPSPGSIADVAQAGAKAAASTRAAGRANLDALGAGQEHAPEVQALKQEQSDNARLEQADIESHLQASKDAEAKATEAWNQAAANKKNFKFRDYWSNKSTARRIGSAIAVAFGAYGASLNHTQNYALEILHKEMDDDHRNQVAEFGQFGDAEVMAKTGIADARAARVQGLTDIGARSAASDRAIAAKAAEVAQITADEQAKARLLAFGKELEARADQTELTTKAGLYNSILKGETERAKNAETAAHMNLMNAQAGKLGRVGTGGGGSNAIVAMQNAVDRLASNEEIATIGKKFGAKDKDIEKAIGDVRAARGSGNSVPKVLTDSLTGTDLPIDPTRTDARKHNAAVGGLPQVNGAIQILDSVLESAKKPHAPELLSMVGVDTSKQADLKGQMTRFRSAYAASKKESVGEANAKELAEAIPDPPSNLSSSASFANWRRKIESTRAELHDTRNALLANAGVPPAALDKKEIIGGKAPAANPHPDDERAIQWAQANKSDPRAQRILKLHGM